MQHSLAGATMSRAVLWVSVSLLTCLALSGRVVAESADAPTHAAIDAIVAAQMQKEQIPGLALGIFRDGKPWHVRGYGMADLEHRVPVTPDSVFQSGSVGKMFTATAVMLLARDGKLALDDSIARYFPQAPEAWRKVTVRHLLSHRSGIPDYDGREFDLRRDYSNDQFVTAFAQWPLEFEPGSRYSYSNSGYVLLGILIQNVSGQFYGELLSQRLFGPLGMTRTRVNDLDAVIADRVDGYALRDKVLINDEWVSPAMSITGDGSLLFSVNDLGRWDAALYGDAVLPQQELETMFAAAPLSDGFKPLSDYGFGWETSQIRGHRLVAHGGRWQGFATYLGRFIDDRITVVVLTNLDAASPGEIARRVMAAVDPDYGPYEAIADDDPRLSGRLQTAVFRYLRGAPSTADFATRDLVVLQPAYVSRVRTDAGTLDDAARFYLVDRNGSQRTYRIEGEEIYVLVDIALDRRGRIESLHFREG